MTIIQAQPLKQFGISGPISAIDNEVPVFDGVTGKKIKAATGITSPSSGRLKMSSTAPYLTLHNTAHEDTDYGRESELIFKGEQSGGEETTLGKIQVAHDGTADDQKGIMSFKVNDGDDADAPGTKMTILANGNVGIGTDNPSAFLDIEFNSSSSSFIGAELTNTNALGKSLFRAINNSGINLSMGVYGSSFGGGLNNLASLSGSGSVVIFSDGTVSSGGTNHIAFRTGGYSASQEKMRINHLGNVGIGTTSPTAKLDIDSDILRLRTAKTPASAGDTGNQGDMCWDADFHYRCVATNTWKRTALTTW